MLLFALLLSLLLSPSRAVVTEVTTQYGRIKGNYEQQHGLVVFYGVPFAAPPTGDLRLKPPVAPTPWKDVRDCTRDLYFHICPQFHSVLGHIGEEDCLYMNIYVPVEAENQTLPVMFWIYGGGYSLGDDGELGFYRGRNLAVNERVIVVEHNYRLGALGFLGSSIFRAETPMNTTGNFALQDQHRALNFTYWNIANFGGDPKTITIFGESAGAFSVCWHLVSPMSRGLFSAAIMESGTCSTAEFFISPERAQTFADEVIHKIGCEKATPTETVSCLRSKPVNDFFMSKANWPKNGTIPPFSPIFDYGPTIDRTPYGLLDRPIELIRKNQAANVPLIIGVNKDEGTMFVICLPDVVPGVEFPFNDKHLNLTVLHFFNESTALEVMTAYPASAYSSGFDRASAVLRDFFFLCSTEEAVNAWTANGNDAYFYLFDYPMKNWVDYDLLGNYHSSELPFVFDNAWPPVVHLFNEEEKMLSSSFQRYWSNMAVNHGDPNHNLNSTLQAVWPKYDATNQAYLHMRVPTVPDAKLQADKCAFWRNRYSKYYFEP